MAKRKLTAEEWALCLTEANEHGVAKAAEAWGVAPNSIYKRRTEARAIASGVNHAVTQEPVRADPESTKKSVERARLFQELEGRIDALTRENKRLKQFIIDVIVLEKVET